MQTIQNDADLQLLYAPLSLHLKPLANLVISISLPAANIETGKTISNFEVMDKLRTMILPDTFSLLKVSAFTRVHNSKSHVIHSISGVENNARVSPLCCRVR
jgi:arginine/serine-rich splicing factor 17